MSCAFRTTCLTPLLLIAGLVVSPALANWPSAPDENLLLFAGPGADLPRAAVPDEQGGVWVVWDSNQDAAKGPHLQHINATGDLLLGPTGLRVADFIDGDIDVLLADDGGVFVAWEDYRSDESWDIYAQKVSALGVPEWEPNGRLVARGPDVAVAVGELGAIKVSLDGGESWVDQASGSMLSLRGVAISDDRVLAVGDGETLLLSEDHGANWSVQQTGIGPGLNDVDLWDSVRGIAVGDGGRSWKWNGSQWTLYTHAVTTDLTGVSLPALNVATAVGKNGRIARSIDRGETWVEQTSGVGLHLNDVSFSTEDVGTAVGNLGIIVRTTDGGNNWTVQTSGTSQTLLAVDFFDDLNGVATGENDAVIYTRDGGATWSAGSTPTAVDLAGVDMSGPDTAIAVGENGTILKSVDGGANWTLKDGPGGSDFLAVSAMANPTWQYDPTLVADGSGGVMVLWSGQEAGDQEVFAQRLDGSGTELWAAPVRITDSGADVYYFKAVPRIGAGAIVVWSDGNGNPNQLRANVVDNDGNLLHPQPVAFATYDSYKADLDAVSDGFGGCLVTWYEVRNTKFTVLGTRLDSNANDLWLADGEPISVNQQNSQTNPGVVADGIGGGTFVWTEIIDASYRIRAQRRDATGNPRWPSGDIAISGTSGSQRLPSVAADGFGGLLVSWIDDGQAVPGLGAQSVSADGSLRWPGGVLVRFGRPGLVFNSVDVRPVVSDGRGGLVAIWAETGEDGNPDEADVYAQNVDRHGYLGLPEGAIDSVVDVPQDEGGMVTVSWDASYLDAFPHQVITHYSIWRSNPAASKRVPIATETEAALKAGLEPELITTMAATGWAFVGTSPAAYLPQYGFDAPTYGDQTPTETPITDFQVIAHTGDPFVLWTSLPAGGTSIDNLAPGAPVSLLAAESGGTIELVWNDDPDGVADLAHYRIYRGFDPGFSVDPASLLTTAVDKNAADPAPGGTPVYYRVSAVDVHGNESPPSNLAGVGVVTGVELTQESRFFMRPIHPNPTAGTSILRFSVPAPGPVRVELYDLAGRRVLREEMGSVAAGWHQWMFRGEDHRGHALASGTYLVRLSHAGQAQAGKIMLTR